ncbi:hypothetical protein [uncultured Kriegella sp.]|uniref:hypothetical protein n=1 Tax=uncultured Kriegella sp. TaxID=1798910 RepID=UPI0030DC513D|tara:strand:+ start:128684 stop:129364 length:681 start_codon:yes stop_codon:yes gene_type:complete
MELIKEERKPKATLSGSYRYAWQQMWKYFLYLFLIAIIVGVSESPTSILKQTENVDPTATALVLQLLAAAYMLLFLPVIKYGADLLELRAIRNEKMDIVEIFDGFKRKYLNIILANLLTFALIGFGFVFLIVPGIILACRLVFVSFLVMDKNMEPIAAVEKSWEMTKGHGWRIFGMALFAIPVIIAGLLFFVVGIVISLMLISLAFAALYHAIDSDPNDDLLIDES